MVCEASAAKRAVKCAASRIVLGGVSEGLIQSGGMCQAVRDAQISH
jgi:hypothetical protein